MPVWWCGCKDLAHFRCDITVRAEEKPITSDETAQMAAARESEAAGAGGAQLAATAAASTTGDPKHTDSFVHMRPDGPDGAGLEPCGLVTPETCIEGTSGTDTYAEFFVSKQ